MQAFVIHDATIRGKKTLVLGSDPDSQRIIFQVAMVYPIIKPPNSPEYNPNTNSNSIEFPISVMFESEARKPVAEG